MRIYESAVGRQLRIYGNMVCVPADVCTTVNMLPRTTSDLKTVAVQLKRRSQYQHALLTSNVRHACIRDVGHYLAQCPLFQQEMISFSDDVVHSLETNENITVSDTHSSELSFYGVAAFPFNMQLDSQSLSQSSVQQTDIFTGNTESSASVEDSTVFNPVSLSVSDSPQSSSLANTADEVDTCTEAEDTQVERAGVFDTLFTSADFVEDSERSAVYGYIDAGLSVKVYSFPPTESNRSVSIFLDHYSEELVFSNIFWGNARTETH